MHSQFSNTLVKHVSRKRPSRTPGVKHHCTKKWSFPLRISSVNVTKSAGNWETGHQKMVIQDDVTGEASHTALLSLLIIFKCVWTLAITAWKCFLLKFASKQIFMHVKKLTPYWRKKVKLCLYSNTTSLKHNILYRYVGVIVLLP